MDAEINDSPSTTLQQYLGFNTTRKRFEPGHNLFTFPLVHSAPLNTIVPVIETTSTLVVERLTLIFTKPLKWEKLTLHRMLVVISQTLCFSD